MKVGQITKLLLVGAALLSTSACGGGGGGVVSTPPAPITPTPTPTPAVTPTASGTPLSAAPAGVSVTTSLASIGDLHDIRWDAASHAYVVSIGTFNGVSIKGENPTVDSLSGNVLQSGSVVATDGSEPYGLWAYTGLSYTRLGWIYNRVKFDTNGSFAFGVPTPPAGVPLTGTASYSAQIVGNALDNFGDDRWGLSGSATFLFDFGAGTLSGKMNPVLESAWDPPPTLPAYNFTSTVFSRGSTTFSGSFDVTGPTPGSFQGQFTGPNAQELMAGFTAPYFDAVFNGWGVLQGVLAGKR